MQNYSSLIYYAVQKTAYQFLHQASLFLSVKWNWYQYNTNHVAIKESYVIHYTGLVILMHYAGIQCIYEFIFNELLKKKIAVRLPHIVWINNSPAYCINTI